jgi:hypothetical protein
MRYQNLCQQQRVIMLHVAFQPKTSPVNNRATDHMSSHVPFLAVRPDEQFSTEVKPKKAGKSSVVNAVPPSQTMESPPPLTPAPNVKEVSRIPANLRFPLLCLLSFSLSTLFHTLTADITGIQIATASRAANSNWEISALLGWRAFELFAAWSAGYDCMLKL